MQTNIQGSFYSVRGLIFLITMCFLMQLTLGYAGYFALSKWYGITFKEVLLLATEPDGSAQAINIARYSSIIFMVGAFLFPAWLFGVVNGSGWVFDGGLKKKISIKHLAIFLGVLVMGWSVMGALEEISKMLPFSPGLHSVAKQSDAAREIHIGTLLDMQELHELWVGLLVAAALPAICEEMFFRGVMLHIFHGIRPKIWFAVSAQALIFALAHFSMYQFLSIFFMGMVFGLIARKTHTIWYTVVLHFLHNGILVVFKYFDQHGIQYPKWIEQWMQGGWVSILTMALLTLLLYFSLFKNKINEQAA